MDNDNIITLIDENGKELDFEMVAVIPYKGKDYVALVPAGDEECDEAVILEIEEQEDGSEELITIESDEVFEAVSALFEEMQNG